MTPLVSVTSDTDTVDQGRSSAEREYGIRLDSCSRRAAELRSTDRLFGRIRLGVFASIIGVSCMTFADVTVPWWWLSGPIALFVAVLWFHAPVIRKRQRADSARQFYTDCLARLAGRWKSFDAKGNGFVDGDHPWSSDLDVFGQGSLFQKLNQCRTLPGQRKLAEWLTTVVSADTVRQRQLQTESLKDQLDLRERLASIDDRVDWDSAERALNGWLSDEPAPFPRLSLWAARILGVLMLLAVVLFIAGTLRASVILLVMLLHGPVVYANRNRIKSVMDEIETVDRPLRQLAEITEQFETFPFTEKSLQQMQHRLIAGGQPASAHISALSRRVQWLNNSLRNQFFIPVAWSLGLFIHLPHRIERWRADYGECVADWMDAVTTLEVLNSIAAFNYDFDTYCLPEISEETTEMSVHHVGHPLLPTSECVHNDVELTESCPLMLISGSNMSGKSTLLRSLGVNLVLAYAGARVNARSFRAYPFQLGTAMRISDSLQEGRSLFFSVVQRLKAVVDLTRQDRPVLFLLDEILSGTNSHDRRHGAEAVIRTLVDKSALGIVTTHDLTLTRIVDSMNGKAVNMHFEDQVEGGQMSFDYRLREGVVERSNAIELMRMMGLDV